MPENPQVDQDLLKKMNRIGETWPTQRKDLSNMIYFSLAVITVIFINMDKLDLVAGPAVVKVIDVFGLLLLFIVPIWSYYERSQGDRIRQAIRLLAEDGVAPENISTAELLEQAASFSIGDTGYYSFFMLMAGMGIIVLNIIAYIMYGLS